MQSIALLPEQERQQFLNGLTKEEKAALFYDWSKWARPSQIPPDKDWLIWLLLSGRGFGKTRTGSELVRKWAEEGFTPIALVGQTKGDARDTMVEVGESSILKVSPPWFMPVYEPSKRRLTWPNGVQGIIYSGDEPDQLRGPQHSKAWVDELSKFMYPQQTWDNLMMGLRIGTKPQVVITTTPRPIKLIKDLAQDRRAVITKGHTLDNKFNLAPEFLEYILSQYEGTRLGRQELAGEILSNLQGLVYDSFRPDICIIPRFAIPPEWARYLGHDFGRNNKAVAWYAQEPNTGYLYLYRTYMKQIDVQGQVDDMEELSGSEPIRRRVGGNHQEEDIRDGYRAMGWAISEPITRNPAAQILKVYGMHKQNKIYVFSDLHDYIEEKLTFSYEIDKDDLITDKIHNESQFHLMAAERYVLSDFPIDPVYGRVIQKAVSNH